MNQQLRDIFHRTLEDRGLSNIGISAHQYALLDTLGELVTFLVARETQRLRWASKDDGG